MQQDKRKRRLQQVKELIRDKGPISDRELKALVDVEHGIREETTTSYLRSLQNAGFIMWNVQEKTWSIAVVGPKK